MTEMYEIIYNVEKNLGSLLKGDLEEPEGRIYSHTVKLWNLLAQDNNLDSFQMDMDYFMVDKSTRSS